MWETIKQILQKNGGTCIIIEEGKPAYIVTKFEEYSQLPENQGESAPRLRDSMNEQELLEKINQEINNWKAKQVESSADVDLPEEEDVKIENLPII